MKYFFTFFAVFLLAACAQVDTSNSITSSSASSIIPAKMYVIGSVSGTETTPANGVIQVLKSAEGSLLKAEVNIQPIDGQYYALWLVNSSAEAKLIGSLRSRTKDVRHGVSAELDFDAAQYNTIRISTQPIGSNATVQTIVASGTLKAASVTQGN